MQEENKSRAQQRREQHRQEKKRQHLKIVAILLILFIGVVCIAFMGRSTGQEEKQPVDPNISVDEPLNDDTSKGDGDFQQTAQIPILPEEESWKTVLVNSTHALEDGYMPELVNVDNTDFKFDKRAADAMNTMLQDARAEGLSPMICSSYRSWERQTTLFEKQVEKQQATGLSYEEAYEKAKTVVAYPGTSEHQTGLTADIVATSHQLLDDSQADTPEQQWLMANSWKYGFILRYPKDKGEYTGIIYEPWHYRYVGTEVAQYITENGLCLEEYWQQVEALQQPAE